MNFVQQAEPFGIRQEDLYIDQQEREESQFTYKNLPSAPYVI